MKMNCFKEAVVQVAERPEFADILGATPYALRRGIGASSLPGSLVVGELGDSIMPTLRRYGRRIGPILPANGDLMAGRWRSGGQHTTKPVSSVRATRGPWPRSGRQR
jgi:hypothetical protein